MLLQTNFLRGPTANALSPNLPAVDTGVKAFTELVLAHFAAQDVDLLPTKAEMERVTESGPGFLLPPRPGNLWEKLGDTHHSADFLISAFKRLRPSHSTESGESEGRINSVRTRRLPSSRTPGGHP